MNPLPASTKPVRKQNAISPAQIERHELKYLIRPEIAPEIRRFINNFCKPDPYAVGHPPLYTATTIQLDNHRMDLCNAKANKALNRFKLRIRTYGTDGIAPVFFEIKRKVNDVILKSRARMHFKDFSADLLTNPNRMVHLFSEDEHKHFIEFIRLTRQLDARPKMLIRYKRESYCSINDNYARVSMDHCLQYRPTRQYNFDLKEKVWRSLDVETGTSSGISPIVLELKTDGNMPTWMGELIERFYLNRTGFCKYANAVECQQRYDYGFSYAV